MRLTAEKVSAIEAATRMTFGPGAIVRLFGSRVEERRSFDIDLHVETATGGNVLDRTDELRERLSARIDEQRIDLIGTARGEAPIPIAQIAYRDGVVL